MQEQWSESAEEDILRDVYRESLFKKLKVQSRVGVALEAIRRGFVSL